MMKQGVGRSGQVHPTSKWHLESEQSGTCSTPTDHKLCSLHITRGWRLQQGNIGSGYKLNNGIISQRGHSSQIQTPAPATLPPPPPLTQLCFPEPNLRATLYFFENLYRIWGGGLRATCNFAARVARVNVARVLRSQVFYLSNSFG